ISTIPAEVKRSRRPRCQKLSLCLRKPRPTQSRLRHNRLKRRLPSRQRFSQNPFPQRHPPPTARHSAAPPRVLCALLTPFPTPNPKSRPTTCFPQEKSSTTLCSHQLCPILT